MSGPGASATRSLGVVVIGRNEGHRLRRCLESIMPSAALVVYVDSGSTDGSQQMAVRAGAVVLELDRTVPFTAARARNAGFWLLRELVPEADLVQFVDGDCEVVAGWAEAAEREIRSEPQLAVVCGRRRERHPDLSIYNRLCDLEWDTPVGDADACGGDALMRVAAVADVNGYDANLIAGEEPDLCLRMRRHGWRVRRIDVEMTLHDAAMTEFGQWWKRSLRAGHAFAEGAARHGGGPERHWVREARSNWFWGVAVPGAALGLAAPTAGLSLALFGGHALLARRIRRKMLARGLTASDARLYAAFCVLGKLPQGLGQALYWSKRLTGRRGSLIEYKQAVAP